MVEEVNSWMIYLIHCKNICKCHSAPTCSTTIKERKEKYHENNKIYFFHQHYPKEMESQIHSSWIVLTCGIIK
jgi:hypothetical protein